MKKSTIPTVVFHAQSAFNKFMQCIIKLKDLVNDEVFSDGE